MKLLLCGYPIYPASGCIISKSPSGLLTTRGAGAPPQTLPSAEQGFLHRPSLCRSKGLLRRPFLCLNKASSMDLAYDEARLSPRTLPPPKQGFLHGPCLSPKQGFLRGPCFLHGPCLRRSKASSTILLLGLLQELSTHRGVRSPLGTSPPT